MALDWKDALAGLKGSLPEGEEQVEENVETTSGVQREPLYVLIDRRQRKGKTATIIEGFVCDDDTLKEVAKTLKQKIGTGGSARGGEILLQGEWVDKAVQLLSEMGYRLKNKIKK